MPAPTVVTQWPISMMNGVQLQFSSIALAIDGTYFPWITEVSYEQSLDPGEARGTSPYPMGVTLGEYKASGSLTVHRAHREEFLSLVEGYIMSQTGLPGFMSGFFPVMVTYQEIGWPQVEIDTFFARITGLHSDGSTGNGVLLTKFPLYIPIVNTAGHVPTPGVVF